MSRLDHFLQLNDIKGESLDDKHKDWIEVLSFNFNAVQGGTTHLGGGGGKGRVALGDLTVTKNLDTSSPALFQYCCSGQPITKAVLVARKAGKQQQDYYTVTLTDLLISSHATTNAKRKPTGTGGGSKGTHIPKVTIEVLATETVMLNYSTITIAYNEQAADGSVKGAITKGWDAKQNKII